MEKGRLEAERVHDARLSLGYTLFAFGKDIIWEIWDMTWCEGGHWFGGQERGLGQRWLGLWLLEIGTLW